MPDVELISADETAVPRTGAVGSFEEADVTLPVSDLERLWTPEHLERLARAYWRYLGRISLGLIKVVYRPDSRTVVLGGRPFALLRFQAPTYHAEADCGRVRWCIDKGLLVSRTGRAKGHLSIEVARSGRSPRPGEETIRVRVEVKNFYPLIRGSGRFARLGTWLYSQTQLRIHRLVTYGFLRSLARLDLPPSEVGALRTEIEGD